MLAMLFTSLFFCADSLSQLFLVFIGQAISLSYSQLKSLKVKPLNFLNCGPVQNDSISAHTSNTWPVHRREAWRQIPSLDESVPPRFRGRSG
jgi:hypothetical protein